LDSDLALVVGFFFGGLGAVSLISAFSDGRRPATASLLLATSAGFVVFAIWSRSERYRLEEMPDVFFNVIGRLF